MLAEPYQMAKSWQRISLGYVPSLADLLCILPILHPGILIIALLPEADLLVSVAVHTIVCNRYHQGRAVRSLILL